MKLRVEKVLAIEQQALQGHRERSQESPKR